jgi:hypothetical protein
MNHEAISQTSIWKNPEVQSYCCAFVKTGLNLLAGGISYFGSDDIPEDNQPISHAIPGCAISMLRTAHIIEDFYGDIPDKKIYHGRRSSGRKLANGRKVNLFRLVSRGIAEEFLSRNKVLFEQQQMELF